MAFMLTLARQAKTSGLCDISFLQLEIVLAEWQDLWL